MTILFKVKFIINNKPKKYFYKVRREKMRKTKLFMLAIIGLSLAFAYNCKNENYTGGGTKPLIILQDIYRKKLITIGQKYPLEQTSLLEMTLTEDLILIASGNYVGLIE